MANDSGKTQCVSSGAIATNVNNLVEDGSCSAAITGEPNLGPLEDNGGSTLTYALLPGSRAIDAGDNLTCLATDQRGVSRPFDGDDNGVTACDVGAFEYTGEGGICPDSITVVNNGDNGAGTLRQALADICDGGMIDFASELAHQTIVLTSGQLSTNKRLTITNPNASDLKISGNNSSRVFYLQPGAAVTMGKLAIISGTVTGFAPDGSGGGIFVNSGAALTIDECTISGNSSIGADVSGKGGGGIYNDGVLEVNSCNFDNNLTTGGGGSIYNQFDGTLTVDNSIFSNNLARNGGAIFTWGGTIRRSIFRDSSSANCGNIACYGGTIFNDGTLTLADSSLINGSAEDYGGGIFNAQAGTLILTNTSLIDNHAGSMAGGIDNEGTVVAANCTFSGNSPGGIYSSGYLGKMTVQNCTLSSNSGGGLSSWGTLHLYNTLIANNSGRDCSGIVTTNDHNLIADGTCSPTISGDPRLGPLADNGGPSAGSGQAILTFALLPGSPAIDAGAACLATDQRGVPRPQGAACDIGAFESQGFSLALAGGNNQSARINTAFARPLSVTLSSAYGEPVGPGGVITFTAPGGGASLAPALLTAATDAGGAAGVTATANGLAGSYAVTATTRGVGTPVTFHLTNTLPPPPAMAVLGNGQVISDGDATPSASDSTDFGGMAVGQAVIHTFTISNSGLGDLTLTGAPRVSIAGPAALDFSLVASPSTPVAPNATTTFQVRFAPSIAGTRVATVTIANNDPLRNPYDFAIQGTACGNAITVTNDFDSSAGSLRQAIADACDGGRVTFAADYTIYLNSTLEITRRLTIDGEIHAIIVSGDSGGDGTSNVRVFSITYGDAATLTHLSIVSGTTAIGDAGGGIDNWGTLTVQNSTFSGNSAGAVGGGISNWGTLMVQNSTFSGNSATFRGGGIRNNQYATLIVQNSTLSGNSAGYYGGGIYNYGTLTVQNSTLSGNSAPWGGGIYNMEGTLHLSNTLIANSPSGGDCLASDSGSITTNDHSLIADGSCSSVISGYPHLGPLGNYGGDTSTFPLLPGSPAIDAGAACLATDQRGVARPQGAACDIGAFELQGFSLTLTGGNDQSALINSAFAQPLSVTLNSAYGEPVGPGGVITFTAPSAGAGLAPAILTAATNVGGTAGVTVTANGLAGSYVVIATARGVSTPVTFHLTNTLPPAPALAVLGNGQTIADGDATPSTADGTDFGEVTVGQSLTRTFIISNGGTADLTLTGAPLVSIGGPAALDFSLVVSPTTPVAPGATTTFHVRFTPSVTGTRVATVTIANDDPLRNPYNFAIRGQGTASDERPIFLPLILKGVR